MESHLSTLSSNLICMSFARSSKSKDVVLHFCTCWSRLKVNWLASSFPIPTTFTYSCPQKFLKCYSCTDLRHFPEIIGHLLRHISTCPIRIWVIQTQNKDLDHSATKRLFLRKYQHIKANQSTYYWRSTNPMNSIRYLLYYLLYLSQSDVTGTVSHSLSNGAVSQWVDFYKSGLDLHTGPILVTLPVLRMWPESGTLAGSMRIQIKIVPIIHYTGKTHTSPKKSKLGIAMTYSAKFSSETHMFVPYWLSSFFPCPPFSLFHDTPLVSQYLLRLTKEQVSYGLSKIDLRATNLGKLCPIAVDMPCQPRKYRSYNGFCNNVQNPHWGSANTRYNRFLSAQYSDGISAPRKSISGDFLPSPREITLAVHSERGVQHKYISALFAYWGQFVAHDISHTSKASGRLKSFESRSSEEMLPSNPQIQDCRSSNKRSCLKSGDIRVNENNGLVLIHTLWMREHNRIARTLKQINGHWNDEDIFQETRKIVGAELQHLTYTAFLPVVLGSEVMEKYGLTPQRSGYYTGYDINMNPGVSNAVGTSVLQFVITMMPQNFKLFDGNLKEVGSMPFSETNFEPQDMLKKGRMDQYLRGLLNQRAQDKDAFVSEEFTNKMFLDSSKGNTNSIFFLLYINTGPKRSNKKNPCLNYLPVVILCGNHQLWHGFGVNADPARTGPRNSRIRQLEEILPSSAINQRLERSEESDSCECCRQFESNLQVLFQKYLLFLKARRIPNISFSFRHVGDVDLFTGGLAETALDGAVVGPTFACILGRQFHYLRRGDRYWYENDMPPSSFNRGKTLGHPYILSERSKAKLEEIRKSSLISFLCANAKSIDYIQPEVLMMSDLYLGGMWLIDIVAPGLYRKPKETAMKGGKKKPKPSKKKTKPAESNAFMNCKENTYSSMDLTKWRTVAPKFDIPRSLVDNSANAAKKMIEQLVDNEKRTFDNHVGLAARKSPEAIHYRFSQPKRMARQISNQSIFLEFTSASLLNSISPTSRRNQDLEKGLTHRQMVQIASRLGTVDVSRLVDVQEVLECDDLILPCDHTSVFRTYTGWCNNLISPESGKSMSCLRQDTSSSLTSPRQRSNSGKPLPSPRLVSTTVHYDVDSPHVRYSLLVMQFGQFLDHDLTMTPVSEGFEGSILDCKLCDSTTSVHPECYPIQIPDNDSFYPSVNRTTGKRRCLSFTRSMPGQLTLGFRQQMNQITSYIDASSVYGSDKCDGNKLRSFARGKLNVTRPRFQGRKPLLPLTGANHECKSPSGLCFDAGDIRASEQPGLASLHTIFMRQHNAIVEFLSRVNRHWNDEQLYQNGRRINGAILQHIAYKEFLPRVLGWDYIYKYDLDLLPQGYSDKYDEKCKANLLNEFAGAAFRFGHSLIRPTLPKYGRNYINKNDDIPLRSAFFNSDMLHQIDTIDDVLRGLVSASMESLDNSLTNEITNHLFEDRKVPFSGLDLGALNIQRGREHGFPPYNEYRQFCNLSRASTFSQLSSEISPDLIEKLKSVYDHVDDIDLFTGGLAETPLHGGLVGPTFGCIIGVQFWRLRHCDRHWYEHNDPLVRLTQSQLMEIRKMTLAKIICDNSESIQTIQSRAMDLTDPFLNPRISCKNLPSIDYKHWQERLSCSIGNLTIAVGSAGRISPCVMCTCTKEGPMCQSIRVRNCLSLAKSFPIKSILKDDICKVQCAHAFTVFPRVPSQGSHILGFSRT
ncbi:Peroxidasin [Nymphon striatum]|nr:Peroxidasin [Nymphon striatum]